MRNNLNADRVRRHRARSTPDTVRFTIDTISSDCAIEYQKQLRKWLDAMRIKHEYDGPYRAEAFRDDMMARFPGETVITLKYVTLPKNDKLPSPRASETVNTPIVNFNDAPRMPFHYSVDKEDLEFTPPTDYRRFE